jgi:hypothetical protein
MSGKPSGGNSVKKSSLPAVKTSLQLDALTAARLAGLVAISGDGPSSVVAQAIENHVNRLGADKKAAIQQLILARLGKNSSLELETDIPGRGSGPLESDSLAERTKMVNRMADKFTAAVDIAVSDLTN